MSIFRKKAADDKETLITPLRSYNTAREALHGGRCQTGTFITSTDGITVQACLQAQRQATGKWDITEITRQISMPVVDLTARKKVESGVCFLKALEMLAKFEAAQINLGRGLADPDEKEKLEYAHFERFAHREGIVFDTESVPHETADGEVVTEGVFETEDVRQFQKTYADGKQRLQQIFESSARSSESLVAALVSVSGEKGSLNATLDLLEGREAIRQAVLEIEKAQTQWVRCLDQGFDYIFSHNKQEKHSRDLGWHYVEDTIYGYEKITEPLDNAIHILKKYAKSNETPDTLSRPLEVVKFALLVSRCQQKLSKVTDAKMQEDQRPQIVQIRTLSEQARKFLEDSGMPRSETEKLEAAVLEGLVEAPKALPAAVTEIFQFYRDMIGNLKKEALLIAGKEEPKALPPSTPPAPSP